MTRHIFTIKYNSKRRWASQSLKLEETWAKYYRTLGRVMRCNNVRTWELNCYSQRTSFRNIKFLPRWSLCLIYFGVVVQIVRMKKPRKASINIEAKWGTDLRGNCAGAEIYGHHRFSIYLECGRPWPPLSLESLLLHDTTILCTMYLWERVLLCAHRRWLECIVSW